jgi:hypothetical protein
METSPEFRVTTGFWVSAIACGVEINPENSTRADIKTTLLSTSEVQTKALNVALCLPSNCLVGMFPE